MLKSSDRLRKKEVERLFKKGKFFRQDFLTVRFALNRTDHYRVAIVVPKAVSKKATERNRLKRVASTHLQEILPNLKNHQDVMFCFKISPAEKEIGAVLTEIFRKLESQ